MFYLYEVTHREGHHHYRQRAPAALAGSRSGLVATALARRLPNEATEPYRWHLSVPKELPSPEKPGANSAFVIDANPRGSVQLFELLDIWGFSDHD